MEEEFFTPQEVADKLKVSVYYIRKVLNSKKLKGVKFGRDWRIRAEDLEMFIQNGIRLAEEKTDKSKSKKAKGTVDTLRPASDGEPLDMKEPVITTEEVPVYKPENLIVDDTTTTGNIDAGNSDPGDEPPKEESPKS